MSHAHIYTYLHTYITLYVQRCWGSRFTFASSFLLAECINFFANLLEKNSIYFPSYIHTYFMQHLLYYISIQTAAFNALDSLRHLISFHCTYIYKVERALLKLICIALFGSCSCIFIYIYFFFFISFFLLSIYI